MNTNQEPFEVIEEMDGFEVGWYYYDYEWEVHGPYESKKAAEEASAVLWFFGAVL